VTFPVKSGSSEEEPGRERWLEWAASSHWTFRSYYKYSFTFTATGSLLLPPADFTATLSTGGDASGIYRYQVTTEPMTWAEAVCGGDRWYLTVTDADGALLFSHDHFIATCRVHGASDSGRRDEDG
jgi:hypothetical protein